MKSLEEMKRPELMELAKKHEIKIPFGCSNADLVELIREKAVVGVAPEDVNFDEVASTVADFATPDELFGFLEGDFGPPVATRTLTKEEMTKEAGKRGVYIEFGMAGYYVVQLDDDRREILRKKHGNVQDAIRHRNRIAGL